MSEYWQHEETGMVCKSATRPSKRYYNITSSILTEEIMRLTAECETLRHDARVMAEALVQSHNIFVQEHNAWADECDCKECAIARRYINE